MRLADPHTVVPTDTLVDGLFRSTSPEDAARFPLVELQSLAEELMDDCNKDKVPDDPVSTFAFQVSISFAPLAPCVLTDEDPHAGRSNLSSPQGRRLPSRCAPVPPFHRTASSFPAAIGSTAA